MTSITVDRPEPAVSRSDKCTIDAIFRHPVANNLAWRDVVALFEAIGEVADKRDGKTVLKVGARRHTVQKPHGNHLLAADVIDLRHFLLQNGYGTPSTVVERQSLTAPDLLVTVDHHEAHVYHLDVGSQDASEHAITPYDPHHFLHHLSHKDQPREHGQRSPEDEGFYEEIAHALAPSGRVVIVGHGKGHSNAAMHLVEHLRTHHHDTFGHIAHVTRADFSDMTLAELLDAGRRELRISAEGHRTDT